MISKTSEYALRAVIHLARRGPRESVRAAQVAQAIGVPANYLAKILGHLAKAGILDSERGRAGGYRLARQADEITLGDVIEAFEPESERRQCLLGKEVCSDEAGCPVHSEWKEAIGPVHEFFRRKTVADLVSHRVGG